MDNCEKHGIEWFESDYNTCPVCALEKERDRSQDALVRIQNWAQAYPLDIFPKPDLKKAREVLKAAGMTLDAISAGTMRHVILGVKDIVREGPTRRILMPATESKTSIRCPTETCCGSLYQEVWMRNLRCDTCLKEFVIVGEEGLSNDEEPKATVKLLLAQIEDLKDKLSEIRSLSRGY